MRRENRDAAVGVLPGLQPVRGRLKVMPVPFGQDLRAGAISR